MAKPVSNLINAAVGFLLVWYLIALGFCCWFSLKETPEKMPAFGSFIVVSVVAVLAANFAAVLGISGYDKYAINFDKALKFWNLFSSNQTLAWQLSAAWLYFISVAAIVVTWCVLGWTEDETKIVSVLPTIAKSLIGVLVGGLSAVLGGKQLALAMQAKRRHTYLKIHDWTNI